MRQKIKSRSSSAAPRPSPFLCTRSAFLFPSPCSHAAETNGDSRRETPPTARTPLFASAASAAFSRIRLERKEGRERGERENLYILLFLLPFTPSCHAEGRKRKGERGAHGCSPVTLYTTPGPADRRRATPPPPGQTGRAPDVTQIRRRAAAAAAAAAEGGTTGEPVRSVPPLPPSASPPLP